MRLSSAPEHGSASLMLNGVLPTVKPPGVLLAMAPLLMDAQVTEAAGRAFCPDASLSGEQPPCHGYPLLWLYPGSKSITCSMRLVACEETLA